MLTTLLATSVTAAPENLTATTQLGSYEAGVITSYGTQHYFIGEGELALYCGEGAGIYQRLKCGYQAIKQAAKGFGFDVQTQALIVDNFYNTTFNATQQNDAYAEWEVHYAESKLELNRKSTTIWAYIKSLFIMLMELTKILFYLGLFYLATRVIFVQIPRLFIQFRDSLTVMLEKKR